MVEREIERAMTPFGKAAGDVNEIREGLLGLMWDNVGVLRDAAGLQSALEGLKVLKSDLHSCGLADANRVFAMGWHDWLNLQSLIDVSEVIAAAALSRENSRGAHYREDFTDAGDLHESYFTVARQTGDSLGVERQPVEFTIVKPGESLI